MNRKHIPSFLGFIFLLILTLHTGVVVENKVEKKEEKKVEKKTDKKGKRQEGEQEEKKVVEKKEKEEEGKDAQTEVKFDFGKSTLDDKSKEQLKYFLQVPPLIKKINAWEGPARSIKVFKRRIAKLLKKAADISTDTPQKDYLNALSADVKTNNFSTSSSRWLNLSDHKVDIIVKVKSQKKPQKLEIFILLKHPEYTKTAEKYTSILDKMMENIPLRERLGRIDASVISPIIVADVAFTSNPNQFVSVFPDTYAKDKVDKFKIVIFSNILESYFKKFLEPLAGQIFTKKWAERVDFNSYLSNIIMHRVSHYSGPIFINQKSDKVVLIKDRLKDLFYYVEEIRAEAAAICNTQVLIDAKLITEEQEKNIYSTYVTSLIGNLITNPESKTARNALTQFNHYIKSGGIIFDLNTNKLKIDKEQFGTSARRLMLQAAQLEVTGNYEEAQQLIDGKLASPSDELKKLLKNLTKRPRKAQNKKVNPPEDKGKKQDKAPLVLEREF